MGSKHSSLVQTDIISRKEPINGKEDTTDDDGLSVGTVETLSSEESRKEPMLKKRRWKVCSVEVVGNAATNFLNLELSVSPQKNRLRKQQQRSIDSVCSRGAHKIDFLFCFYNQRIQRQQATKWTIPTPVPTIPRMIVSPTGSYGGLRSSGPLPYYPPSSGKHSLPWHPKCDLFLQVPTRQILTPLCRPPRPLWRVLRTTQQLILQQKIEMT